MLVLWAVPALAQDTQTPTFEQQARQVLRSHLQQAEQLQVGELLDQLAQETRLPREQVRVRLAAWLDTLEVWRKQQRREWEKLVKSGGAQTSAREAERFLRQFVGQARQALEKQTGRPVEELVDQAAKKAQVLTYQGRDLLLRLLSEEESGPLPDKVGLLVEVRNLLADGYYIWGYLTPEGKWGEMSGANPRQPLRAVGADELDEYLLPVLVEELSRSPHARWALGRPKPALQPDWRLVLELKKLDYPRTEPGALRQFLTGEVVLYDLKGEVELYRQALRVNSLYSEELDEQGRGAKFLRDIGIKTREVFEGFWAEK